MNTPEDDKLEAAIREWFQVMHPEAVVTGYVLQIAGVVPEDDIDQTRMTFSVPDNQPLHTSLGLIEYARLEAAQWHGDQERLG